MAATVGLWCSVHQGGENSGEFNVEQIISTRRPANLILKSCADVFAPVVARIANLSFTSGKFPSMFRIAQVLLVIGRSPILIQYRRSLKGWCSGDWNGTYKNPGVLMCYNRHIALVIPLRLLWSASWIACSLQSITRKSQCWLDWTYRPLSTPSVTKSYCNVCDVGLVCLDWHSIGLNPTFRRDTSTWSSVGTDLLQSNVLPVYHRARFSDRSSSRFTLLRLLTSSHPMESIITSMRTTLNCSMRCRLQRSKPASAWSKIAYAPWNDGSSRMTFSWTPRYPRSCSSALRLSFRRRTTSQVSE